MFEKLIDIMVMIWEWLLPFQVVDSYERGVILRFGKFNREIGPGFRWLWPLGIESARVDTVVLTTSYLDVQSLTSMDGKSVAIAGIITYDIKNISRYLLEVDEPEDVIHNIVYGCISKNIERHEWQELLSEEFNEAVYTDALYQCMSRVGVRIIEIQWSDKSTARNLRLWND